MALDTSMKMGLIDISLVHIMRKKKQSPRKIAKKIIETCNNVFRVSLAENPDDLTILCNYVSDNDLPKVRTWVTDHYL